MSESSPTLRRRLLASRLKALRTQAKLNRDQAAQAIQATGTTITRIESATSGLQVEDVQALLKLYGVVGEDSIQLMELARDARRKDWWQPRKDVILSDYEFFFGLETEATTISTYQIGLVPGLLQTRDYHHEMLKLHPVSYDEEDASTLVAFRAERQQRRLSTAKIHMILDESVLRRLVGGPEVMNAQLAHIRQIVARHDNVHVQVLPFSAGPHRGMEGSFSIMSFPINLLNPVVFYEFGNQAQYLEADESVALYNQLFDHLSTLALSSPDSLIFLEQMETTQ